MRFTLIALAASQALAMRPELARASVSKTIASIGDIMSKISSAKDSLASLKEVSSQVSALIQQGPVDDHIDGDDRQLLSSVISLIEKTIYSSMDDSHNADVAELAAAIKAAEACNADIALRQSAKGDLGILHAAVQEKQQELDRLQGVVDDKTEINNTKWEEFDSHMQMISTPPACPGLPARTMPALDVYFEKSEYSMWFAAQQSSYTAVRDAFVAADGALDDAIQAYNIQKAVRDVQYCDWKSELEAACAAFDACFKEKSDFYTNTLVPRVTSDMNSRIEIKKAGDTVVHQINFLLGAAATQETPTIDTSRYEIEFPSLPAKGLCDLTPLGADEWVPPVSCFDLPRYESRPLTKNIDRCAKYEDTLPGAALGSSSHTVVMSLDFLPEAATNRKRQWIFNLGKGTRGDDHWLYSATLPERTIQFGVWGPIAGGGQVQKGNINPSQTLATTYDASTKKYSLYVDGVFSGSTTTIMNIQNGHMCVGKNCHFGGDVDFSGCVRGVDVYRAALTADEVVQAVGQLEGSVRRTIVPLRPGK